MSQTTAVGEEMISLASIGTPGVVEEMPETAGFADIERWRSDDGSYRIVNELTCVTARAAN